MKRYFQFVMILLTLSFFGCDDGSSNNNNNNINQGTKGSLTIDGLPNNGTRAVYLFSTGTDISTFNEIVDAYTNGSYIAVGASVSTDNSFPLYKWVNATLVEDYFTNSGLFPVLLLNTAGSITDLIIPMYSWTMVNFSNGIGTVNYSQFEPIIDDSLALASLMTELLLLPSNDADTPHDVVLNISLKSLELNGDPLGVILPFICGKYINLDLSGCRGTSIGDLSGDAYQETYKGESNRKYLVSIILPETVTSIGVGAFSFCTSLKSITLPSSLFIIKEYAFHHCYELNSVVLPVNLEQIGTMAFYGGVFALIDLPASITNLGMHVFWVSSETVVIIRALTPPEAKDRFGQTYWGNFFVGGYPGGPNFNGTAAFIYVPDGSINAYKTALKWNEYSTIIKPISEKP